MKISGTASLAAPVEEVWRALNDPAVLVRTIPGCERLEEVGPDRYRMTITAGVASIRGTYEGEVALADQQAPSSFVLKASGAGAPGTVNADVTVTLAPEGAGTRLSYDADAVVGGMVGGVGQRMLTGVARKTAGEFFSSVDAVLASGGPVALPAQPAAAPDDLLPAASTSPSAGPAAPRVFAAPAPARAAGASGDLLQGLGIGAAIALLGVIVGAVVGGRFGRRRS
ncbi:MAG: SRPBCC family protein [Actinomycetes bacterium]